MGGSRIAAKLFALEDFKVSDYQIIDLFDSTNITLRELSRITGQTVSELKALLLSNMGN